ncbi:pentatricopeptide repeat-containing protein CRP1, chloroplastic isoform X3 [Olea europaea var. sylvestris]|uniref:pentatricopeptide repeat-containing protein CRP1, chloroplastic isoform X3 n=1 Tax=Olea europaea var. sylvestris TaxID=158386 RepID=UPI000C1D5DF2|nr:pentatricopeptide repeat-containing protein CRP1, chloroplastic isoform X3 [Olea europaea var. sylvestris]XP_022890447.1 pentatricopeptide repeat-containing protein CRP1, chloroplastic isoform X3 [Olea europaea var. sylvestris]
MELQQILPASKSRSIAKLKGFPPFCEIVSKFLNYNANFKIVNFSHIQQNRVKKHGSKSMMSYLNSRHISISEHANDFYGTGKELSRDSYNETICELCKEGDIDSAMTLVSQMEALGYHPNSISYTCLITALGSIGRTLEADAIFNEMILSNCRPGIKVFNALLKSCLRKGLLELADKVSRVLDDSGLVRNRETFEILIDYYVHAGRLKDTWLVISQMKRKEYQLDSFVYSKIIELYRDNGMWKKAIAIMREIREMGIPMDRRIYNSIIDTFGKYGELEEALEIFERMQQEGIVPDVRTWNSLIQWNCKFGNLGSALDLFSKMLEQGIYPDPKIFVTIITRLGEQGKWDSMKNIFENLKGRGHQRSGAIYAVLVDIYGHYGKFQNAEDCISTLKLEGLELSPSIFCVLANAYAQQGLCEQTVRVLQLMEAEGMEPNLIMLNVLINAFGTAGRHMEALSIYRHIRESSRCSYLQYTYEGIYTGSEV